MAIEASLTPHRSSPYGALSDLVYQALRRYGDMNPATIDGDVMLMFIGLANEVIEEILRHPYWGGGDVEYYTSQEDVRGIPDEIMVTGLLARYAEQQSSDKLNLYLPKFYRAMNSILYRIKYGVGSQDHDRTVLDKDETGYTT